MKLTFNQVFAAALSFVCLGCLMFVYFCPAKGNENIQLGIVVALTSGFTGSVGYLIGSSYGSQQKTEVQADTNNQLIDALKGSAPVQMPPQS